MFKKIGISIYLANEIMFQTVRSKVSNYFQHQDQVTIKFFVEIVFFIYIIFWFANGIFI